MSSVTSSTFPHIINILWNRFFHVPWYSLMLYLTTPLPHRTFLVVFIIFLSLMSFCGEGNGTPCQYSCLEDPMDGGAWGHYELDTTERLHFHFSLSRIGGGNGNPLQCSCLENPRDRGAWWAAVCGVTQSRTRLMRLSSSSSMSFWRTSSYVNLHFFLKNKFSSQSEMVMTKSLLVCICFLILLLVYWTFNCW